MSKALQATCVGGVVTAGGFPILDATILSEGVGSSEGLAVIEEDKTHYIADTTPDLKETLERLIEALGKLTDALDVASDGLNGAASGISALDSVGFIMSVSGGSGAPAVGIPSPPVAAGDIATIESSALSLGMASTEITAIGEQIEVLKGMLK